MILCMDWCTVRDVNLTCFLSVFASCFVVHVVQYFV